jgi:hypothetical protein
MLCRRLARRAGMTLAVFPAKNEKLSLAAVQDSKLLNSPLIALFVISDPY